MTRRTTTTAMAGFLIVLATTVFASAAETQPEVHTEHIYSCPLTLSR
jgi:hypothetical protein